MSSRSSQDALVCCRCKGKLEPRSRELFCRACGVGFPCVDGIADFSGGAYYDIFPGPEVLSTDNLEGLRNEKEGARIEHFYLPLLDRVATERGTSRKNFRVLDSGCGNGESVDLLNREGFDAWGHDLSALRKWQWATRERRERLVVADGSSLPFVDGFFDAVIGSGVLEHIGVTEQRNPTYGVRPLPDRDDLRYRYLAELIRVLAPSGRLFLDFPNGDFPVDFWHGTKPGEARFHSRREGFLPKVREVRALFLRIDRDLVLSAHSPEGRLRFNQVSSHWYGRVFRIPMAALFRLMSLPSFRFIAATSINPYLVIEVIRPAA